MPIESRSSAATTVVYVEDQHVNVLLMKALFGRRPDLRLLVATTGQEALALVEGLQTGLLLLDIRLPDCLGTELLPMLRQHPGCRDVPAVAVTAEHNFRIEGTGFAEVWTKPLRFDAVMARLAELTPPDTASDATHQPGVRSERERSAPAAHGWR